MNHPADAPFPQSAGGIDSELVERVAELADRVQAGDAVDLDEFVSRHPQHAEQLRRMLPSIEMLAALAGPSRAEPLGRPLDPHANVPVPPPDDPSFLGDFQILREIGRGGMGVVYEARQISLNRNVALKVLPAAAALDARRLQRFRQETQAVACLNHPHVVPVFSVGRDRGVPYYAMLLVEGLSLAEIVRELRWNEEGFSQDEAKTLSVMTRKLSASLFASETPGSTTPADAEGVSAGGKGTGGHRGERRANPLGDRPLARGRSFFRTVARLGCQAAEALGHAHQHGVLHRDVKPANLLVDARGDLWITDFGLARLQGDNDFTMTGDLVGTLRYMSPEQALGRRDSIDHRTDIYSLGATLYELITLRPAFVGQDRHEVLRRIVEDEPTPPRMLNPSIPVDLENVVLKAMAKSPSERYATAECLAADLRRFLEDRPVLARRPTVFDLGSKWARRHRPAVTAAAILTALVVTCLTVTGWWSSAWLRRHNLSLMAARDEADRNRLLAERRALLSTRRLFASQVRQAQEAWEAGHIERAQELLHDPDPGPAPRGFAWDYLWRQTRRDFDLLWGHEAAVHSLAIAPDGKTLASGDNHGDVLLWDIPTRRLLASHRLSTQRISRLVFAPDGSSLAVLDERPDCSPGTLALWDLDRSTFPPIRRPENTPAGSTQSSLSLPLDPFLNEASAAHPEFLVRLVRRWEFSKNDVCSMVFDLNGGRLFVVDCNGLLCTVRASDGAKLAPLTSGGLHAASLAIAPDGTTLAVGCEKGFVVFRDLIANRETAVVSMCPEEQGVIGVWFSRDGTRLAALSLPSREIVIYDRRLGRTLPAPVLPPVTLYSVAFAPDGTSLALGCAEPSWRLWDLAVGEERATFQGATRTVWALEYTPDGHHLVMGCLDPAIRLWHRNRPPDPPAPSGTAAEAWAVTFSPDGQTLLTAGDDGTIRLWDVHTGQERMTLQGHGSLVTSLAVSRDGRTLVSGGFDFNVRVWSLCDGRLRRTLSGHTEKVRSVAVAPDGRTLASTGTDKTVRVWDAETGRLIALLEGHTDTVRAVAFDPTGAFLASAGNDRTARIWSTDGFRHVRTLTARDQITSLDVSADGTRLVGADRLGIVNVWDVRTGARQAALKGPAAEARSVSFSPDGALIATGYEDRTVRVWDLIAGQEVLVLKGHGNQINSVTFAPDGRTLASCDHNGVVKLWHASPW